MMITDGNGNRVTGGGGASLVSYRPFGEIERTRSSGPDIFKQKYTGQTEDKETGLYYYGARYYDAYIGRFLQADSFLDASDVQGQNLYAYVNNNPMRYTDPSGHIVFMAAIAGLVVGAVCIAIGLAIATVALAIIYIVSIASFMPGLLGLSYMINPIGTLSAVYTYARTGNWEKAKDAYAKGARILISIYVAVGVAVGLFFFGKWAIPILNGSALAGGAFTPVWVSGLYWAGVGAVAGFFVGGIVGYLSGGLGGYINNGVWDESEARHRAGEYAGLGARFGFSMGLGFALFPDAGPGYLTIYSTLVNMVDGGFGSYFSKGIWSGPIKDFGYGEHYQKNWYDFLIRDRHSIEDRSLIRNLLWIILFQFHRSTE